MEALIQRLDRQLLAISVPARDVFPEQYDTAMKRRRPLLEEKQRWREKLEQLQRDMAEGVA